LEAALLFKGKWEFFNLVKNNNDFCRHKKIPVKKYEFNDWDFNTAFFTELVLRQLRTSTDRNHMNLDFDKAFTNSFLK
jgi:hypothetical protein